MKKQDMERNDLTAHFFSYNFSNFLSSRTGNEFFCVYNQKLSGSNYGAADQEINKFFISVVF
jgi:hypothetical protein